MVRGIAVWSRAPWWRPTVRVLAVLAPLVTCAILAAVRDEVTAETSVLLLVVWVVVAAATGDRWAGVLAALSAGAWFDFFLTEPYLAFTIDNADDVEATVLLVMISLAVTEIALWGRRQQQEASRRSGYLEGVLGAARSVAEADAPTGPSSTWWPGTSPTSSEPTAVATSRGRLTTHASPPSTTTAS